jgi:predicted O-methyltransferase YrrM
LSLALPVAALKAIRRIEGQEFTWRRDDVPCPPSLGRESADEPVLPWSVPRSTAWLLYSLVVVSQPARILEVGTSLGYSTIWLAAAANTYGGQVETVEAMHEKAVAARRNLRASELANWTLHECLAGDLLQRWRKRIDMLFLDADAEAYGSYWDELESHLSDHAVVVADNVLTHPDVLEPFVRRIRSLGTFQALVHPMDNGLLVARRRGRRATGVGRFSR